MDKSFIGKRITDLRLEEDISEYKLSMYLGKSKSYINNITCGKTLPSVSELYNICDYFNLDIKDFFDESNKNPVCISETLELLKMLPREDVILINSLIRRLVNNE